MSAIRKQSSNWLCPVSPVFTGAGREIEAVIDTGYNGCLTLSDDLVTDGGRVMIESIPDIS